ncbi:hypothetical protein [Kluyvera genomosp. 3]|uniref:Uncharacterized protein n=1 Tax=Kluyvera genomosp. 3 TaxID=2774055 RepID=A0A6G9RL89_9ENTR|nr:hypothetical protein [Kluyvera genomosp. 3]QIR27726.1 hypothetical protein GY169_13340 [Kluyvera genomosp. 3]
MHNKIENLKSYLRTIQKARKELGIRDNDQLVLEVEIVKEIVRLNSLNSAFDKEDM